MIGVDNRVFLDTNILVYASIGESIFHDAALEKIQTCHKYGMEIWISHQILREFLAVHTRPNLFVHPLPLTVLIEDIRQFQTIFVLTRVLQKFWRIY